MGKGEETRNGILEEAFRQANRLGLEGVTIGALAEALGLSKSGLFAHFQSKEALQLATLEFAAARFVEVVMKPTLAAPRGEPRLRALLEGWLDWAADHPRDGGCFFAAAAFELDHRPGPVRDRLVQLQRDFHETMAQITRTAIAEGHFRSDVDPTQVAFELYGVMLAKQHYAGLLEDPGARDRAWAAFDALVVRCGPGAPSAS